MQREVCRLRKLGLEERMRSCRDGNDCVIWTPLVLHVCWRPISLNIEFWGGSLFLLLVLAWVFGPEVIVVKWGRVCLLKAHSSISQVWVQILVIELMRKNTKALISLSVILQIWICKMRSRPKHCDTFSHPCESPHFVKSPNGSRNDRRAVYTIWGWYLERGKTNLRKELVEELRKSPRRKEASPWNKVDEEGLIKGLQARKPKGRQGNPQG